MIRTVIENLLLFLLPTLAYAAWVLFTRWRVDGNEETGQPVVSVLDEAPFLWLFATGALIVVVTLAAFGSNSGGKPGQHYQPPTMKDGKIEPGHID
jgi:hypothetical protein